jgi:hypothetical protein
MFLSTTMFHHLWVWWAALIAKRALASQWILMTKRLERMGRQESENRRKEGNTICRHHSYQAFIHLWRGHTGCGNCIKCTSCVLEVICGAFPDDTGDGYVGYHEE